MSSPRFSIIVPHYDGSISDAVLLRGLDCLAQQRFGDFEVLLYHDGPLSRPLPDLSALGLEQRLRIEIAGQRHNDWGHSLRHRGIAEARGEYIVHFNPDNLLYPEALEVLDHWSRQPVTPAPAPELLENPDILIFAVLMRGMHFSGRGSIYRDPARPQHGLIYAGFPTVPGLIDCLQLVARATVWREIGGWYDRSAASDGQIYSRLVRERGARYVPAVLGEHW
ncbi:glycosyltransferase family 2 protein [Tahibacter harae]|uniref:Glycosyltransferase n=1 Tax=Tahibacter harae TaxID=2963937 RepID=A0ABT1QPY6_9GAMM|nr:glycosyltransferase family 2 protein [Tahibacter harae]MCQ4164354.1 glycosyltransferase [Tahibacter harae]